MSTVGVHLPGHRPGRASRAVAVVLLVGLVVGGGPLLLGPPGGDDAYYHAMYALEHARCWLGGVPFPAWYPDLNGGLGGPEPRARPQIPLALHAAFALVLGDAVAATSLATAVIPVVAGLLMLTVARRRCCSPGACLLAAVAWCASPYLLVSLHERAALQEAWAVALLPWLFDALLPPAPASRRQVLRGGVALAVVLATQLLVAFMAGLVVVVAHAIARGRRPARLATAGGLGLGLAAASWVPNVLGLRRLQGEVFESGWFDWRHRFLLSASDPAAALNLHLTLVAAALVVSATLLVIARGRTGALGAGALACVALATPLAAPLWAAAPGFALLQFPWRWLGPASALAVLALASAGSGRRAAAVGLLFVIPTVGVIAWAPRLTPGLPLRPLDPPGLAARAAARYGVPPILPSFPAMLPRGVDLAVALLEATAARAELQAPVRTGPRTWEWRVTRSDAGLTILPLLADEGWRVRIDGGLAPWRSTDGLVGVRSPAGSHTVVAVQTALPEAVLGTGITLVTVLVWMFVARRGRGRAAAVESAEATPAAQRGAADPA